MRYAILIGTVAFIAACGGGGDSVPGQLKDVCTQADDAATETIEVVSPDSGDEVRSPLTLNANVTIEQPILYISIVAADGTHVADYPGRPETGTDVSFVQPVPFGVEEETVACLWVSHKSNDDPGDAIRVPVTLLPGGTR